MSVTRIKVENLSKQYQLGEVGTGTISHDLNRWWAKMRGKEDPFALVGAENDRTLKTKDDFVWALRNIDFAVKEGEILGIIGRNGAGKSTLLKILSQVTGPTQGKIKINGRIGALLEVGTGMHQELTGLENIYLNGAILGMSKREIKAKIDDIIDFAGIAKYADTPFKRYSSGMRVRLGFAVAAFLEPEILIVDEVLAVGDAEFQKRAIGKMQEVSEGQGRAVLFVSHNMASVRSLCTSGLILENGSIAFKSDDVSEAIDYYLNSGLKNIEADLNLRTDRINKEGFKFTKVAILNSRNLEVDSCFTNEKITLKIYFNKEDNLKMKDLIFAISIVNKDDNVQAVFRTDELNLQLSDNGKDYFEVEIPNINLRGGIYSLNLYCSKGKASFENILDKISRAYSFEVITSDIYHVGKPLLNGDHGFIYGKFI